MVHVIFLLDLTTTAGLGCLGEGLKWVPDEGKCIEICEHNVAYEGANVAGPDGTKSFMLDGLTVSVCQERSRILSSSISERPLSKTIISHQN